jgi:DNA-binding transcriptional LysR family regulator
MRVHVHRDHPLAQTKRPLRLSDLAPHGWAAMDESFGVRQHIQAAELDENVKLKPALLTNSFKILWEFASQGLGYVVNPLSMPLKGPQFRQMVSLPLANPILNNSRTHVISLAGRHLPPATASMLRHILKTFPALEAQRASAGHA